MSTKKIAGIVAFAVAALVAIACSSGPKPTPVDGSGGGGNSTAGQSMFTYGQTVNVGGKFEVTVSAPVAGYKPGQYAAGYTGGAATAFDVTIKNASQAPLSLFTPSFSANTAEGPADSIFDSANKIEMPTGELFPGESTKFRLAFNGAVVRVKVEGFLDMAAPAYFQAAA